MAKEDLAHALCETLSLFQDYELEKIILEMDKHFVETHHQLTVDDLEAALSQLIKEKKVQMIKGSKGEKLYRRCYPKKSWYQKFLRWWEFRK